MLRAYTNDIDTYVCHGLEDLAHVIWDHCGEDHDFDPDEWEEIPQYEMKTIHHSDGNDPRTMSVADWCVLNGRGFLCSTEF